MDSNLFIERPGDDTRAIVNVGSGAARGGTGGGISIEQQARPARAPARPPPARMQVRPPAAALAARPPPPQRFDDDDLDTYAEFANPNKMRPPAKQYPPRPSAMGGVSRDDDDGSSQGGGGGGSSEGGGSEGGGSEGSEEGDDDDEFGGGGGGGAVEPEPEEILRPGEGFRTLDDEKADILFKLSRLRKQGVRGFQEFTTYSDIRDMRTELAKVRTELEVERSIQFQRKMLMGIVSALEFGNNRWDPFDLYLDGWSETVHEKVDEFDGVFEELYFKYRGKMSTPPEIRLMLMLGGSGLMFHMQHAMFKKMLPNMGDAMRNNPEMMQNVMKAAMGGGGGGGGQQQQQQQQQPQQQPQEGQRREMRGPGIDVGSMMGGGGGGGLGGLMGGGGLGGLMGGGLFGGGMTGNMNLPPMELPSMMQVGTMPPPAPSRSRDTRAAVAPQQPQREQPQRRNEVQPEDDRFSDVISEDLESVPDDLGSVDSEQRDTTRSVVIQPKKRKAPAASARGKQKVIII